jgi:hypothetical protein
MAVRTDEFAGEARSGVPPECASSSVSRARLTQHDGFVVGHRDSGQSLRHSMRDEQMQPLLREIGQLRQLIGDPNCEMAHRQEPFSLVVLGGWPHLDGLTGRPFSIVAGMRKVCGILGGSKMSVCMRAVPVGPQPLERRMSDGLP